VRFVIDSMLGKLARWLRLLGYDSHYQRSYRPGVIDQLMKADRCLLTRSKEIADHYLNSVLLYADNVGEQLAELKERLPLAPDRSNWFSRCLICNVMLQKAQTEEARENVPDYVFYQNITTIHRCPSCGRYYWPGSHRTRMLRQLKIWGLIEND
jgi:uncharacterized protein with PIN domain